jgi:hypothetical protein
MIQFSCRGKRRKEIKYFLILQGTFLRLVFKVNSFELQKPNLSITHIEILFCTTFFAHIL